MKLALIASNYPDYENYCPNNIGMKAGLDRLGIDWKFFSCRGGSDWVSEVIKYDPTLVVYGLKDIVENKEWREKIRNSLPSATIVFWYGDLRNEQMNYPQADCSKTIDAMFVSNDAQSEFYKDKLKINQVYFLPLGAEKQEPEFNKKFAFDFVFVGSKNFSGQFYDRAKMITKFEEDGAFRIDSQSPPLRKKIYQAMPSIYKSSKISLDISHFTDVKGYTSNRYWNIPASHGFALTKRFPGCEEFYPEDMRAYFDTIEEGLEKKKYYLEHNNERQKMAYKAHIHSINHTHDTRFREMFRLLGTNANTNT